MTRARKVDDNQAEIVLALRQAGASVALLHTVGDGVPDVVVGYRGVNYLLEIKDGSKPASKQKLTPDETAWHAEWRGQAEIVRTVDEALKTIGAIE